MKKHKWTLSFTACLLAFTVFVSLDTFVLSSAYQEDATQMNTAMFDDVAAAADDSATDDADTASEKRSKPSADDSGTDEANTASEAQSKPATDRDASAETAPQENTQTPPTGGSSAPDNAQTPMTDSTQNAQGSAGAAPSGKRSRQRKTVEDSTDAQASSDAAQAQETPAVVSTARSYEDENVRITLTEQLVNGTTVYVADVQLSSAEYLKTAFANDTYGKNVTATTSAIAAAHNAILAVNGDYYGARERGYVIRNGIVYRDSADDADVLCIYADGTMEVVDPSTVTAQELVARGVWQAFSFGPALVEDGTLSVSQNDEVGRAKASNPRTALGMIDPLHYVFVVSDGRTDESEGLSLYELAELLRSLGVQTAYNLDGGGSSSMVFQGELINNPTTTGNSIKERGVSDIVYIG